MLVLILKIVMRQLLTVILNSFMNFYTNMPSLVKKIILYSRVFVDYLLIVNNVLKNVLNLIKNLKILTPVLLIYMLLAIIIL
jgi:hypothetical protein